MQDIIFFGISFALIFISYYFFFMRNSGTPKMNSIPAKEPQQKEQQPQQQQQINEIVPTPPTLRARQRVNLQNEDSDEDAFSDDDQDTDGNDNSLLRSQKEMQREAKRQEKKQQREVNILRNNEEKKNNYQNQAIQQYYDQREKKDLEKRSKYDEKERLREIEQLKKEEEDRKQEELQRIKEQEEFDNWKKYMEVEEVGQGKVSAEEEEKFYKELNEKIMNYIKLRKVVVLEEMTGEFKMTTQEVIDRIKSLELNNMLNGIIDERGKYIYITPKELESVKNYILSKGRVSRPDLIAECNRLIKLDPSKQVNRLDKLLHLISQFDICYHFQDKEKINREENELLLEVNKEFEQIKMDQK